MRRRLQLIYYPSLSSLRLSPTKDRTRTRRCAECYSLMRSCAGEPLSHPHTPTHPHTHTHPTTSDTHAHTHTHTHTHTLLIMFCSLAYMPPCPPSVLLHSSVVPIPEDFLVPVQ